MKKKYWLFILGTFILVYLIFIQYNRTYSIANDNFLIKKEILRLLNNTNTIAKDITIQQVTDIDNKKYVLYNFNDSVGEAEFARGINSKYKILYTSLDKVMLQYRVQNTSKGNYFVIEGKNPDKLVSTVKVTIDNKEYTLKIPEQDFFVAYCSVSKNVQNRFPGSDSLKLLDKSGNDITAQINKKYKENTSK